MTAGVVWRLAGIEVPKFEDTEKTFPELQDRIARTIKYAESARADQIDGSEDKEIVLPVGGGNTMTFKGQAYLLHFCLPHLFFHCTTAYNIIRHNGVEVGKRDYMGSL